MIFIERLKKALEMRGISQYKLCKDLDIGQSTISSWKKGKVPSADKIIAIVHYLEVSADWLLGIDEQNLSEFTEDERKLIEAYRKAVPAMKEAARKILDVGEPEEERSSASRTG